MKKTIFALCLLVSPVSAQNSFSVKQTDNPIIYQNDTAGITMTCSASPASYVAASALATGLNPQDIVLIFSQVEVTNDTGANISFNRWMIPASSGSSTTSLGGYVMIPMGASATPNIHHSVAEITTADSGRTGNVYYNFIASCNSAGTLSVNYVQENIQIIRR